MNNYLINACAICVGFFILGIGLSIGIPMTIYNQILTVIDNALALVMGCFNLTMEDV